MRIISGSAKGRRLASFSGEGIRPTSDKVKEAIFNIISSNFGPPDGKRVLDLFAGTGNLGIEALSRGAESAVFVDESPKSLGVLRKNLEICRLSSLSDLLRGEVLSVIKGLAKKKNRFDLVFLDPPYERGHTEAALKALAVEGVLEEGALVVSEHSVRERPPEEIDGLSLFDRRKYGDTEVSFYIFRGT